MPACKARRSKLSVGSRHAAVGGYIQAGRSTASKKPDHADIVKLTYASAWLTGIVVGVKVHSRLMVDSASVIAVVKASNSLLADVEGSY